MHMNSMDSWIQENQSSMPEEGLFGHKFAAGDTFDPFQRVAVTAHSGDNLSFRNLSLNPSRYEVGYEESHESHTHTHAIKQIHTNTHVYMYLSYRIWE